jgi:hypothetical protein
MTTRIELSESGWAELRDPAAVPVRLRRPVEKMLFEISQANGVDALANNAGNEVEAAAEIVANIDLDLFSKFNDLNDLLILARIAAWSYDLPITLDSVLELPSGDYQILQEVTAKDITEMMPNFAQDNDPSSPTLPSNA